MKETFGQSDSQFSGMEEVGVTRSAIEQKFPGDQLRVAIARGDVVVEKDASGKDFYYELTRKRGLQQTVGRELKVERASKVEDDKEFLAIVGDAVRVVCLGRRCGRSTSRSSVFFVHGRPVGCGYGSAVREVARELRRDLEAHPRCAPDWDSDHAQLGGNAAGPTVCQASHRFGEGVGAPSQLGMRVGAHAPVRSGSA